MTSMNMKHILPSERIQSWKALMVSDFINDIPKRKNYEVGELISGGQGMREVNCL